MKTARKRISPEPYRPQKLKRINTALARKDLTEIPANKLLKLKLEYGEGHEKAKFF